MGRRQLLPGHRAGIDLQREHLIEQRAQRLHGLIQLLGRTFSSFLGPLIQESFRRLLIAIDVAFQFRTDLLGAFWTTARPAQARTGWGQELRGRKSPASEPALNRFRMEQAWV